MEKQYSDALQEFEQGHCGKTLRRGRSTSEVMVAARREVWSELRRYRIWALELPGLNHKYLSVWQSFHHSELVDQWRRLPDLFSEQFSLARKTESELIIDSAGRVEGSVLNINAGMSDCPETPYAFLPEDEIVCVSYPTLDHGTVPVVFSQKDDLFKHYKEPGATFLGKPFREILTRLSLAEDEVWKNIPEEKRNFFINNSF